MKYNWKEIQEYHNEGNTWQDVMKHFGVSLQALARAKKRGDFVTRNISDAKKISKWKLKHHTEDTKKKISESRKRFLENNPEKVPYKINHYSHGRSYPEKYWKRVLDNNDFEYVQEFQFGIYSLDFALPKRKIDLEIDGSQHYNDPRIIESDERRTSYLESFGWKVVRVNWSEFQKLSKEERKDFVEDILKQLGSVV